ncbi:EamA/RhaT family transporter [Phyllobacterium brassicacearum]|uniref:EamA/RhaT family transporter n=1 Tax=Phyllobacterium brassicacearum TaxID=314235 RepID=A0A2P7BRH0_9HYPH|nr:DMT family transporter [Phyllobacterium brassicacearum]PSH69058.1 EamA/RhaT family transporter [Phyllobacterium brassicacearum]TDQ25308.1 EamA domain-containing membrane protein RarD [Phyllobacterium brassicacearum]
MNPAAGYRLGLILVTASTVAWSLAGLFTQVIPLDSWTILAWRGIFGSLGIAAVIVLTENGPIWKSFWNIGRAGWLFVAVSALGMVFLINSLKETTVAHVAVIYATIPFVAAVLGWFAMGERSTVSAILASVAALIGVVIMVGVGAEGTLFGDLLAFGMTLCMAVLMIIVRRSPDISVLPAACLSALVSSLICWPLGSPLTVSAYDLLLIAMFGILVSAVGLALFTLGAKHLPAVETALIGSLDAPLAPLWIWLAFGEVPGRSTLIGGSIVFAAVIAHVITGTQTKAKEQRLMQEKRLS